jgi:hypothetical protein
MLEAATMHEAFARLSFDATLDELVDVALKYQNATKAARSWRRTTMLSSGAIMGVLLLFVSSPLWAQGHGFFIFCAIDLLLAVLVGFLAGRAHDHSCKRRVRQYLAEQLRGAQIARGRAFSTSSERDAFLSHARRLAASPAL